MTKLKNNSKVPNFSKSEHMGLIYEEKIFADHVDRVNKKGKNQNSNNS